VTRLPKLLPAWDRWIWQELVNYANADVAADQKALDGLEALVNYCIKTRGVGYDSRNIDEVSYWAEETGRELEDSFRYWAVFYQPEFKNLLRWLCAPNEHLDLGRPAVQFLQRHREGLVVDLGFPNNEFDETGERGYPIFFWESIVSCASIMSPICDFLVERIRRFEEGEIALREAIPIRICDRAGCNKFKLPERQKDRCFCSSACRATDYQSKRLPEQRAAYMRNYRKTFNVRSGVQLKPGRRKKR
jgi:hypothetical protein